MRTAIDNAVPPVSALSDPAEVSRRIERWLMAERLTTTRHSTGVADWTIVCEEWLDPSGAISTDIYLSHRAGSRVPPGPNAAPRIAVEIERLRKVVA